LYWQPTTLAIARIAQRWPGALALLISLTAGAHALNSLVLAEEPLIRNAPMEEFQNRADIAPYNFDAPPEGLFRSIQLAQGFEEELGFRRTYEITPVNPTDVFRPDSPFVYIVFQVHQHYDSYQVFGICYPEHVDGLDPAKVIAQDVMYLALEDESGYIKLHVPPNGWKPGIYRVKIHVGWQANDVTFVGTMRFTVQPVGAMR
jgi:hypothetical protein